MGPEDRQGRGYAGPEELSKGNNPTANAEPMSLFNNIISANENGVKGSDKAPLTEGQQHWENAAAEILGVNNQPSVDTNQTAQYDESILQQGGNIDGGGEIRDNQNRSIDQSGTGVRSSKVAGESRKGDCYDGIKGDSQGKSGEVLQGGNCNGRLINSDKYMMSAIL